VRYAIKTAIFKSKSNDNAEYFESIAYQINSIYIVLYYLFKNELNKDIKKKLES
jgi:hypothetical protein